MKKLIFIIACFVLFTSCVTTERLTQDDIDYYEWAERDARQREIERARLEYEEKQQEVERKQEADRQRQAAEIQLQEKLDIYRDIVRDNINRAKAAGSPILIFDNKASSPNSAGGVNVNIEYINISDKRLKYVYFTVVPFNAVDDRVYCTVSRTSEARLEIVGFINPIPNDFKDFIYNDSTWGNAWYNSTIRYMKITKIEVVFDDDSRATITDPGAINSSIFYSERRLDRDFIHVKRRW